MKYPHNNMITWNRLAVHIWHMCQLVPSTLLCSVVGAQHLPNVVGDIFVWVIFTQSRYIFLTKFCPIESIFSSKTCGTLSAFPNFVLIPCVFLMVRYVFNDTKWLVLIMFVCKPNMIISYHR